MRLLSTTALTLTIATPLGFMAGAAQADCVSDDPHKDGATVICSGVDTDGYNQFNLGDFGLDEITLTVESTAVVNDDTIPLTFPAFPADDDEEDAARDAAAVIYLKDENDITIDGTVSSAKRFATAVYVDDETTITVNGSILTTGREARGIDGDKDITVIVNGSIRTEGEDADAVNVNEGDEGLTSITINAGGSITTLSPGSDAIDIKENTIITNHGTIVAAKEGVNADGDNHTLINTGTIQAIDDAVQLGESVVVTNSGLIENVGTDPSDAQDALDIDSGTVTNLAGGVIRSTLDAAIDFDGSAIDSLVENHGLISGTSAIMVEKSEVGNINTAAQVVRNHGTIVGTSGLALDLGEGADIYDHYAGAILTGGADFGAGDDAMTIFGLETGIFGGSGALFDGGADWDVLSFGSYAYGDLTGLDFDGSIFDLSFGSAGSLFQISVTGWENFSFTDGDYDVAYMTAAATPSAVPVPAGLVLLASALGGFGVLRKRRSA